MNSEHPPLPAAEEAELVDPKYQEEILPLLKILKPEDISLEDYENQTVDELYEDLKTLHAQKGILLENPDTVTDEMKELLSSRIKAVVEDARNRNEKSQPEASLVRRAKIALIAEGDYSDFDKYFYDTSSIKDTFSSYDALHYFGNDLTKSDLDALMHTDLADSLVKHGAHAFEQHGNQIPESFLIRTIKNADSNTNWVTTLRNVMWRADKQEYSQDLFDALIENEETIKYAVGYADKFHDFDIQKLIDSPHFFQEKNVANTLTTIDENYYLDEEIKKQILIAGFKKYNSSLTNGVNVSILEYFRFSQEMIDSPELQEAALDLVSKEVARTNTGNTVHQLLYRVEEIQKIIPLGDALVAESLSKVHANLFTELEEKKLLDLLIKFKMPADFYEQKDIRRKIEISFARQILDFSMDEIRTLTEHVPFLASHNIEAFVTESFEASLFDDDPAALVKLIEKFPFLKKGFAENDSSLDMVLEKITGLIEKSRMENKEIKLLRLKNIKESFWLDNKEKLPEQIAELHQRIKDKYGKKGETLLSLAITAHGLGNPELLVSKIASMEKVLDKYNPETIPAGSHVSMGIEYEVMWSISEEYLHESVLGYKKDINLISEASNIGRGNDGIHEIALKPTYNPYMLLAEVKLLQEADLLDLNFEKYSRAARGYHLSLVGDAGLSPDENMFFLHNILTMTQLAGAVAGNEIHSTKGVHSKSFERFSNIPQLGQRCELKGMACDTVEQFEKAVVTAHHAGIAIQLSNKYIPDIKMATAIGSSPEEFEHIAEMTGILQAPFKSDQERDILFAWMKLKNDTIDAIEQHNDSFVDTEFNGFLLDNEGNYTDTGEHIDIMRNKGLVDPDILRSPQFKESLKISGIDLFSQQTPEFVNALINTNNIFLKPPQGEENSSINVRAMLDVVKEENYGDIQDGKPTESIFEKGGQFREGYYVVQGASEEMITHKSQIALNHFNNQIELLLQKPGVRREISQDSLVSA